MCIFFQSSLSLLLLLGNILRTALLAVNLRQGFIPVVDGFLNWWQPPWHKTAETFTEYVSWDALLWKTPLVSSSLNCPSEEVIQSLHLSYIYIFAKTTEINLTRVTFFYYSPVTSTRKIIKMPFKSLETEIITLKDFFFSLWDKEIKKIPFVFFCFFTNFSLGFVSSPPVPQCSFTLHRTPAFRALRPHPHPSSWRGKKGASCFLRAGTMAVAVSQWWLMGGVMTGHLGQCAHLIQGASWLLSTSWPLLFPL